MNARHPLRPHRRSAGTLRPGIKRLDQLAQLPPWDKPVHLVEKLIPARRSVKFFEAVIREGSLPHSASLLVE
jgi:hypothetical protein